MRHRSNEGAETAKTLARPALKFRINVQNRRGGTHGQEQLPEQSQTQGGKQAREGEGRPITLSVVRGVLETTQREMTLALEKTARSSVFNLAHDYSTALFNARPEMILQGQDIPIHLGSLIPAMKSVAKFFEGDIHEGDLILHNDPAFGGSHAIDTCMYKPVFYKGKLVYWTVCKGHLTDIGGPVPAGYNPAAKEIYAECLRIPPVKIWDKGKPRNDVLNMIFTNMRAGVTRRATSTRSLAPARWASAT